MLAGTFIGTHIIAKSRLAAAESLARSSPIPGIKDNMLWLETSLSASIDNSQASDGSLVTSWHDQSSNSAKPLVVAVGTGLCNKIFNVLSKFLLTKLSATLDLSAVVY